MTRGKSTVKGNLGVSASGDMILPAGGGSTAAVFFCYFLFFRWSNLFLCRSSGNYDIHQIQIYCSKKLIDQIFFRFIIYSFNIVVIFLNRSNLIPGESRDDISDRIRTKEVIT